MMHIATNVKTNQEGEKPDQAKRNLLSCWGGLFFVFAWFFCSAYSFEEVLFQGQYVAVFFLLLAGSMLVFEIFFRKNSQMLHPVVLWMTLLGAFATGVMCFLPSFWYKILFLLSGVLMAPMLLMRLYNLLRAAPEKRRFRLYMAAIALTILFHSIWVMLPIPTGAKFGLLSLFALLSLFQYTNICLDPPQETSVFSTYFPGKMRLPLMLFFLLIVLINVFSAVIHSHFAFQGQEDSLLLTWAASTLLPAAGFMIYAWCADYGQEKAALVMGILFFLIVTWSSFFFQENGGMLLILADGLGGSFAEYQILTFSLYLFSRSRRPVFIGALGLVADLLSSAFLWTGDLWFPPAWIENGPTLPFIAMLSIICLIFVGVVFWQLNLLQAWNQTREEQQIQEEGAKDPQNAKSKNLETWSSRYALTPREKEVLDYILKGYSAVDMAKELFVSERTIRYHMTNIYGKTKTKSRVELLTNLMREEA